MKNFSLYTEELNFEDQEGKNITVGKYETEHFELCPGAGIAFQNLMQQEGVDMDKVEQAAKHVDEALAVEKKVLDAGRATEKDLDAFDHHASLAEETLDDLSDLENHEYYLRDVHEAKLIDMLDVDTEFQESDFDDDEEDEDYAHLEEDLEVEPFWDEDNFDDLFEGK